MLENSYKVAPKFHVYACIIQRPVLGQTELVYFAKFSSVLFFGFLNFSFPEVSVCSLTESQQAVRQGTLYESNMVSFCRNIPENFKELSKGIHFITD